MFAAIPGISKNMLQPWKHFRNFMCYYLWVCFPKNISGLASRIGCHKMEQDVPQESCVVRTSVQGYPFEEITRIHFEAWYFKGIQQTSRISQDTKVPGFQKCPRRFKDTPGISRKCMEGKYSDRSTDNIPETPFSWWQGCSNAFEHFLGKSRALRRLQGVKSSFPCIEEGGLLWRVLLWLFAAGGWRRGLCNTATEKGDNSDCCRESKNDHSRQWFKLLV